MQHILLLDDHPGFGKLMQVMLKRSRHKDVRLSSCCTLERAVEAVQNQPTDLLILDNQVPPHDSFRPMLSAILDAGFKGPCVLLSGAPPRDLGDKTVDRALTAVFNKDYLTPSRLSTMLDVGGDQAGLIYL